MSDDRPDIRLVSDSEETPDIDALRMILRDVREGRVRGVMIIGCKPGGGVVTCISPDAVKDFFRSLGFVEQLKIDLRLYYERSLESPPDDDGT